MMGSNSRQRAECAQESDHEFMACGQVEVGGLTATRLRCRCGAERVPVHHESTVRAASRAQFYTMAHSARGSKLRGGIEIEALETKADWP
jgi:hypothetical protein